MKSILIQIEGYADFDEIVHCLNQKFPEVVVKQIEAKDNRIFIFPQVWKMSREDRKVVDIVYRHRVETYELRESWTEDRIRKSNETPEFTMFDNNEEYYHGNGFRKVASGSRVLLPIKRLIENG